MSIVSDDPNSFTHPPATGSRRVSVLVALPVILGCAVVGSIAGVVHPLHSIFSDERRGEEIADLTLASVKPVENAPTAEQQRPSTDLPAQQEQPELVAASSVASQTQSRASSAVASVSTGSVDRSPSPGPSENAALIAPDRPDVAHSESRARMIGHNHRIARAKRLRRVLWRRHRSKPPGSEVEVFFSSLLTKK